MAGALNNRSVAKLTKILVELGGNRFPFHRPFPKCVSTSHILDAEGQAIKMPSLSPTMMEGTIMKWLKNEGDPIQPGDVLCDIQTDKAVVSFELEEEGILAKILIPEDTANINIGTTIALMVAEGEDWKNVTMPASTEEPDSESPDVVASSAPKSSPTISSGIKSYSFGPSVKLLLEKYGLDLNEVPSSGPNGRVLKGDVLQLVKLNRLQPQVIQAVPPPKVEKSAKPTPTAAKAPTVTVGDGYDDIELSNMRKVIAKRLSFSKSTIAHSYATLECQLDSLLSMRKQLKKEGIAVSVNDLIIKAAAAALTRCPQVNCVWSGDQLQLMPTVDISIAVATDNGLITPIVKGAENLGLSEIASKVRDLAGRAREGKLKLDEFQGGTFTISNLGMFGISEFSAIINPPQCAILAVGGGIATLGLDGKIETRMRAKLSYDRMAIDDDTAAEFMQVLANTLEKPNTMLLGSYQHKVDHPLAALL